MTNSKITERYGNLLKEEQLVTMDEKIMPNTFVLEAPEPFPGFFNYYSESPMDSKPLYIYLVVAQLYTLEQVTRARQNIKAYFPSDFHADAGTVTVYNKMYHVIRIRHLQKYDQIKDLQTAFMDEGIEFKRKPSKKIGAKGIIRLKKFFRLNEVGDGLYLDEVEKDHGYICLPRFVKWAEFEELTRKVKYNWSGSFFDAALGHFHHNFEIENMIRIYNPKIDLELLHKAKQKYLEQIK
ncbi:hypothetical protein [Saccharicrinis fermentans]|uniref:Uncharacterized protein n=1 Tax=Saccharicrinis fermentans DSM 9555 = JCM 21142 TaxID=869213 RepID=W7YIY1_9BACT|nr:hypothetical protein [Saccharicrinis fermentans]GAF02489.1 hypothetical protein JCM21142_31126 [Saccharicrinis fermentans DSM 9555 = JCM 21142]